jgi:hypothetical protein
MTTQELLDPKSWAEQTFGRVHLHDMRHTKRAVQAQSQAGRKSLGVFAGSNADLERTQGLVSVA